MLVRERRYQSGGEEPAGDGMFVDWGEGLEEPVLRDGLLDRGEVGGAGLQLQPDEVDVDAVEQLGLEVLDVQRAGCVSLRSKWE